MPRLRTIRLGGLFTLAALSFIADCAVGQEIPESNRRKKDAAEPLAPYKIIVNKLVNDRLPLKHKFSLTVKLNQRAPRNTTIKFEYTVLKFAPGNAPDFDPIGMTYFDDRVFEETVSNDDEITTREMEIVDPINSGGQAYDLPHVLVVIAYIDGASKPAFHATTIRVKSEERS